MYDAVKNQTTFKESSIVDHNHPPVIVTLEFEANSGTLKKGAIVSRNRGTNLAVAFENANETIGTGDGTVTDFNADLTNAPVAFETITVTDGTQTLTDNGHGVLEGDGSGTINYQTGAVSVKFTNPPANGAAIRVSYANRPIGVLTVELDTSKQTSAPVIKHGTVIKDMLLVQDNPASDTDIEILEKNTQIYAI